MGFQVSPGVQIQERDLSTIIPSVATTPAGFVGQFRWGPANFRTFVTSENDLVQLFGAPDINTFPSFFSAANFLQYGNNLQIVRGVTGSCFNSIAGTGPNVSGILITNRDAYDATSSWSNGAYFAAKYPGVFGNSVRIEVCDGITAYNNWGLSAQFSASPGTSLFIQSLNGGATANDEIHVAIIDEDGVFSGVTGTVLERFEGLSKATNSRKSDGSSNYYKNVLNDTSKYVYVLNTLPGVNAKLSTDSGNYGLIGPTAGLAALGSTAGIFVGSFTGGAEGSQINDDYMGGLYNVFFGDPDNVDVSLLIAGQVTGSGANVIAGVAAARKDCVAFFSAPNINPTESDTTKIANCLSIKNSIGNNSYAFIDSGWKYQYDRYNDVFRWVPSNADVAGLCARTDGTNDPWWSPAGYNRGNLRNVVKMAFNPNQAARDTIYPKGINPIVTFPGEGTILFGDRTAQTKPSAFDRINVRRLFIVLEKAIATAAKYQLFEFNDALTRAMFVSMIEPFLRDVQARRGIYNFKVICDSTNNTPQVIDANSFVADIYVSPAKSINTIKLNFIATRTGVNFEEIAALTVPGN